MNLLAGITHGQAVTLVLLCVFLIIFIIADVYLVLFLRRRNKKLAKYTQKSDSDNDGTSTTENERETDLTEKL